MKEVNVYLNVSKLATYEDRVKIVQAFKELGWEIINTIFEQPKGSVTQISPLCYMLLWNNIDKPKYPKHIPHECEVTNYKPSIWA